MHDTSKGKGRAVEVDGSNGGETCCIHRRVRLTRASPIAENVVKEPRQRAAREKGQEANGEVSELMTTPLDELSDDQAYVLMSMFSCIRYNQPWGTRRQRQVTGR